MQRKFVEKTCIQTSKIANNIKTELDYFHPERIKAISKTKCW